MRRHKKRHRRRRLSDLGPLTQRWSAVLNIRAASLLLRRVPLLGLRCQGVAANPSQMLANPPAQSNIFGISSGDFQFARSPDRGRVFCALPNLSSLSRKHPAHPSWRGMRAGWIEFERVRCCLASSRDASKVVGTNPRWCLASASVRAWLSRAGEREELPAFGPRQVTVITPELRDVLETLRPGRSPTRSRTVSTRRSTPARGASGGIGLRFGVSSTTWTRNPLRPDPAAPVPAYSPSGARHRPGGAKHGRGAAGSGGREARTSGMEHGAGRGGARAGVAETGVAAEPPATPCWSPSRAGRGWRRGGGRWTPVRRRPCRSACASAARRRPSRPSARRRSACRCRPAWD